MPSGVGQRLDQVVRRGRGDDDLPARLVVLVDEDPGEGLHVVDQPLGRLARPRPGRAARFQPLATRAAWRVSSIAGSVSPTMSKTL